MYSSITTILFPVFASYKALRTSDVTQLTPWLIYWVILSLILLVESWTVFIIGWIPFYSWIRLAALSYLVLPQTQGAKLLYTSYVEPFITNHERQIEVFIGDLHEKGSKTGLGYLKQLLDLVRQHILGLPPTKEEPPPASTPAGYAQSLLSRFAMPSAHAPSTSDFYNLLSGAVIAATTSSNTVRTPSGTPAFGAATSNNSGGRGTSNNQLFPSHINTNADKQTFLTSQREKLAVLMKALDREQRDLDLAYGNAPGLERDLERDVERRMTGSSDSGQDGDNVKMRKNQSDNSFQNIDREEVVHENSSTTTEGMEKRHAVGKRTSSGGWNLTTWFGGVGGAGAGSGGDGAASVVAKEAMDAGQGISSGIDR